MTEAIKNQIFNEMMAHPALFTHRKPEKVALIGDTVGGILQEIQKHSSHIDIKINSTEFTPDLFDVIIATLKPTPSDLINYFKALKSEGILVMTTTSPFELEKLKAHYAELHSLGFHDAHLITFPQPNESSGWCAAFMAIKSSPFKRVKEQDIHNRSFATQYYNFDIHKASMVLPEFMRQELNL